MLGALPPLVAQPDDQRSDISLRSISLIRDSTLTLDACTLRLHPRHQSAGGLVDLLGRVAVAISDELDAMMDEHGLGYDEYDKLDQIIAILEGC